MNRTIAATLATVVLPARSSGGGDSAEVLADINRCVDTIAENPIDEYVAIDAISVHTDQVTATCRQLEGSAGIRLVETARAVSDLCRINDVGGADCKEATRLNVSAAADFLPDVSALADASS